LEKHFKHKQAWRYRSKTVCRPR